MKSLLIRVGRRIRHRRLHSPEVKVRWVELGSDYGGWPIAVEELGLKPTIYSFGVGEDISFDLEVIERFDAIIHAFDPTPRSLAWIEKQKLPLNFLFHPVGIGAKDGWVEFFPPIADRHVSFSKAPTPNQCGSPIVAKVHSLDSIMRKIGGQAPEIVKMDIEGFEYEVIESLVNSNLRPNQILVEFHHNMYGFSESDTLDAVKKLREIGYCIFFVSDVGREYGFLLRK